jgi:hypothetical protein
MLISVNLINRYPAKWVPKKSVGMKLARYVLAFDWFLVDGRPKMEDGPWRPPRTDQTCHRRGCNRRAASMVVNQAASGHAWAWYLNFLRSKPLIRLRFRAVPSRPSSRRRTPPRWSTKTAFAVAVEYRDGVSKAHLRWVMHLGRWS